MARLNTATRRSPAESESKGLSARGQKMGPGNILGSICDSPPRKTPDKKGQGQWITANETQAQNSTSKVTNARLPLGKEPAQKTSKGLAGGGDFDIFSDSDFWSEGEREGEEYDSSTGPVHNETSKEKVKKRIPLKMAQVNSLMLPLNSPRTQQEQQQQQRNRQMRKQETDDYDKENDPVEEAGYEEERGSGLSRNNSNASTGSPTRNSRTPGRQFLGYREPEKKEEEEECEDKNEDEEDVGFDSMDDFIVSDNEEPSYHEASSEDETEEEKLQETPPPPPKPRRRLMRGRRADPEEEARKALEDPSEKDYLRLEPSVPAAISTPAVKSAKKLPQSGLNITEKMNYLNLGNNNLSSQLEKDLLDVITEFGSPSTKTKPEPELEEILSTPPSNPSKNRLQSPTKGKTQIPPTPYRESVDAFWSQEVTNDWVDQHSPRKFDLLQEFEGSDNGDEDAKNDIMPRVRATKKESKPKTPSKTALKRAEIEQKKAVAARKNSFDSRKASFAADFLKVLDDAVAGGQVQKRTEETGGVKIVWSKTLQTTAGRASWKRERTRDAGSETYKSSKHYAIIELAERIIVDEYRLLNTIAHEYCHLANKIVSGVLNNPHGTSFKAWGRKCKEALKDHPVYGGRIEVTTKHNYKIDYKYQWDCVECGQNYGRHSKSINTLRSRCGKCKGVLQQVKPKPRNVSPQKKQPSPPKKQPVRSESPGDDDELIDISRSLGKVNLEKP